MDLCADLMSSHMELNGRGLSGFVSRRERLALMKSGMKQGGGGADGGDHFKRHGSVTVITLLFCE